MADFKSRKAACITLFVALVWTSSVQAVRLIDDNCAAPSADCTSMPCCEGMVCYKKDDYWSQCRTEGDIPADWESAVASGTPSPPDTSSSDDTEVESTKEEPLNMLDDQNSGETEGCAQPWGACMDTPCCAGTVCYAQHEWYAQCMDPDGDIPQGMEPVTGKESISETDPTTPDPSPSTPSTPSTPPPTAVDDGSTTDDPTPNSTDSDADDAEEESPDPSEAPPPTTEPEPEANAPETEEPVSTPTTGTPASGDACDGEGNWDLADWDVEDAMGKAWLFFKAQQSGELENGHPVSWRGDSYMNDGSDVGVDLSGGFFDAGDHLKLLFPFAFFLTNVAWGATEGKALIAAAGKTALVNDVLDRAAEFLMACHLGPGEFVTSVGNFDDDHSACYRAQLDTFTPRTVWSIDSSKPGSDLLYSASAALAAYSEARTGTLATKAAAKAKSLFEEGKAQEGTMYSSSVPEMGSSYSSESAEQYGFLAAAWLYRTTQDAEYRTEAERLQDISAYPIYYTYSWSHVYVAAALIMNHEVDGEERYWTKVDEFVDAHLTAQHGVVLTPGGYNWINSWGSMGHASGAAAIIAGYGRDVGGTRGAEMKTHAMRQIAYILGANGRSYLTGFGCNPPQNPHHRDAALTLQQSAANCDEFNSDSFQNANELIGGLVGGPDQFDSYTDVRSNIQQNEVALDYNAQFIIGLAQSTL